MITDNAVLLLGSNMGNRLQMLNAAETEIEKIIGKISTRSKVYETASWGDEQLAPFLNKVIEVKTVLTPRKVMDKILQIEALLGRKRANKWESRIIDIDILFYEDEVIQLPDLIIPHPFLHKRRFTLVPLVEILGSKIHPVFRKTSKELLDELTDPLTVAEYIVPFALK